MLGKTCNFGKFKIGKLIDSEEIKAHNLAEHEAGNSVREIARSREPFATAVQNWKRQAKTQAANVRGR